jgi:Domain of unknown function (DUF397)
MPGAERLEWQKSSHCESSACVEVTVASDGIHLRSSTDPPGPHLVVTREAWTALLRWLVSGESS